MIRQIDFTEQHEGETQPIRLLPLDLLYAITSNQLFQVSRA